jgi:CRP-like cAMP-binding protein
MSRLITAEQRESFAAGRVLFREGDPPRGVFVIHSGTVDLVFSSRAGMRRTLRTASADDVVGLSEAISNTLYACTAAAHTTCEIGFVPLADLHTMLEGDPTLWLTVAEHLSSNVGQCWQSMRTLS